MYYIKFKMTIVWLLCFVLFELASHCSGDMYSLLPKLDAKQQHDDKNHLAEVKQEFKVLLYASFPDYSFYCFYGDLIVRGFNAKLAMIMAMKIGIDVHNCTKYSTREKEDVDLYSTESVWTDVPNFESLYPHFKSDFVVVVRRKKPVSYTLIDVIMFSGTMNILLLVYLVLCALTLHLFGLRAAAFQVYETFLTGGFPSETQSLIRKGLLITLSMTGVILLSALSGIYTSKLAVQRDVKQIQTLKEVNDAVTEFYVNGSSYKGMHFDKNDVVNKLLEKKKEIEMVGQLFINMTKSSKIAISMLEHQPDYMTLVDLTLLDEDGRSLAHIVPQHILSPMYHSFRFRRGRPFFGKLNDMIMRLVGGGVVDYLIRHNYYDWRSMDIGKSHPLFLKRLRPPSKEPEMSLDPEMFTLKPLAEPFFIFLYGLTLATIFFIGELVTDKLKSCIRTELRKIRGTRFAVRTALSRMKMALCRRFKKFLKKAKKRQISHSKDENN